MSLFELERLESVQQDVRRLRRSDPDQKRAQSPALTLVQRALRGEAVRGDAMPCWKRIQL